MPTFEELMQKEHVRNHPMYSDFGTRVKAMRENMGRKLAGPNLSDVFSAQKQIGRGQGDRSLRSFIQEAAIEARAALDMCDFPMQPQLAYNNARNVRMAAHDDSQVVDAEILFNVRICTKSGAIRQALLPVVVSAGAVVSPSTLIYDGRMKVLAQSTIDEIVQRNTSYQLPPLRRMYDAPLAGDEIDRAVLQRNSQGWVPREVITDGDGIRHARRQAQEADEAGDVYVNKWLQEVPADEALGALETMFAVAATVENALPPRSFDRGALQDLVGRIEAFMGDVEARAAQPGSSYAVNYEHLIELNMALEEIAQRAGISDTGVMLPSPTARRQAQDQTNPGTPRSKGLTDEPAVAEDPTQISNPMTDPTMMMAPGGAAPAVEKTPYGQYASSGDPTQDLYKQIVAQPSVVEQIVNIVNSLYQEGIVNNVMQMVGPLMATYGLRAEDVDWNELTSELMSYVGFDISSIAASKKIVAKGKFLRIAALVVAECLSGRRAFGHRRAAATTADQITELKTYLQSAQSTFTAEEYAYYEQTIQEAESALSQGDEQTAKDLLAEAENAFSFTDIPTETVSDPYWSTFVAKKRAQQQPAAPDPSERKITGTHFGRQAQQTNVVKENEEDEDGLTPMKRFMPAGYDLVLEDMVAAEDTGLDSFPRPYSHIEKNYILRRFPTCSRDKWLPHLINDGFALNPYGKGPNRGRPVREASKEARGQGGGAEELSRWLQGVVILKGCVADEDMSSFGNATVELRNYRGESEPVSVAIVHDGSGYTPGAALAVSQRGEQGALEKAYEMLEERIREDASPEDLEESFKVQEEEGYDPLTDSFDGAVFTMSPQELKQVVDTLQGINAEELRVIEFDDNFEEEEPEEGLPPLESWEDKVRITSPGGGEEEPDDPEPRLGRSAQMDDGGEEESWEPNVRAKKDLRTSDGDRIKAGTGGFLMWSRGDTIEVLVPPSIQDSFSRADWEDIVPVTPRTAQMDEEDEFEDEPDLDNEPEIYLDNLDHDDGMVTVHSEGPGIASYLKKFHQSIMGSMWESDGSDFAYAIISDSPNLLEELKQDGYLSINTDNYSPMTAEELQALDPMNR